MTDATLVLAVDSRQVAAGAKSLDELAAAGAAAEKATERLGITTKTTAEAQANWRRNMDGAAAALKASTTATMELSNQTQRILDRYDPLGTKLRSLQSDFALLRREMGSSTTDAAMKAFQGLENEIDKTRSLMASAGVEIDGGGKKMEGLGLNTQYARRELMMLGREALTGDFSQMPHTFASLVTHSNLLQAAISPIGIAVAGVTATLMAGAVAWNHWENAAVESAEKTMDAIRNAHEEEQRIAGMGTEMLDAEIESLQQLALYYEAYASHVKENITRFNWRSSAEELRKYNEELAKTNLLLSKLKGMKEDETTQEKLALSYAKVNSVTAKRIELQTKLHAMQVAYVNTDDKTNNAILAEGIAEIEKQIATLDKVKTDAHQKAITSMIAALEKESATYGMTAAQAKIYEAAKLGMTKKELEHSIALIEGNAAREAATKAEEDLRKQLESGTEAYNKYWGSVDESTAKINENAAQLEAENAMIGKTAEEISKLTSAREDVAIATLESTMAVMHSNEASDAEVRAIALQVEALYRLKAAREQKPLLVEAAKQVKEETKQRVDMWKKIDDVARDTFVNIWGHGKSTLDRLKDTLKNGLLAMLYEMGKRQFLINVGIVGGGVGASGMASAGGMGGITDVAGMFGDSIGYAVGVGLEKAGLGALGGTLNAILPALPWIAGGVALLSMLGSKGTPTSSLGNAAAQFSATGAMTGQQTFFGGSSAGVDAQIASMQAAYMQAAAGLGITTAATQFSFGANTGRNAQNPQFALGGGAGGVNFYQGETASSDTAIRLAASRAVFAALQGSELPQFLSKMFDGLSAGSMTQQDIDNTLAFAGSVKQMRDALLETREPLEILRANVTLGMEAFATSAETFRTDFVAAIDAGINPQVFAQWQQLGTAIDQLAAADAEIATRNVEAAARLAETNLGWQQRIDVLTGAQTQRQVDLANALVGVDASTALLINQLFDLQDAANAASVAADNAAQATQELADANQAVISALAKSVDDAQNVLRASIDTEKKALQTQYETQLATAKAGIDAITSSVGRLTDLSKLLRTTVTSMAVGVTRESAQAQISAALSIARAGGALPDAASLQDAIRKVSEPSTQGFGSYVDYMRDFIKTSNDISALADIADVQLTEQEQALVVAQQQLEILTLNYDANVARLDGIWTEATGIRYAVIDVATALANFNIASQNLATAQAQSYTPYTPEQITTHVAGMLDQSIAAIYAEALARNADPLAVGAAFGLSPAQTIIKLHDAGIPGFAVGTNEVPFDMVAQIHKGEEITPKPFVDKERAARDETNALLARLREEVSQLRAENRAGQVAIARNTNRSAKILEQFDGDGMPAERIV